MEGDTEKVEGASSTTGGNPESPSLFISFINEIIYSPINFGLVLIMAFLIYKIIKDRFEVPSVGTQNPPEPELPRLRRDFTVQELKAFDGKQPDGRILVAVNGKVFDVTKGKRFYGPGGSYHSFAGRDVSRNLASFTVTVKDTDEYDDLSDLSPLEMESVLEWEQQFLDKYIHVGKLLRKGEQPTNYDDDDEDAETDDKTNTPTKPPTASAPATAVAPTSAPGSSVADVTSKPEEKASEAATGATAAKPDPTETIETLNNDESKGNN